MALRRLRPPPDPARHPLPGPRGGGASAPVVALDANAFDRDGSARDRMVDALREAAAAGRLHLFVPGGVTAELRHANAPAAVRHSPEAAAPERPPAPLTPRQHIDRIRVRAVMRGDGRPGKHDADASHLSEAAEAGAGFFLTRDGKILRKRDTLRTALPPGFRIVTIEELLMALRAGDVGDAMDPPPSA